MNQLLQKYNVEEDPTYTAPPPLFSFLSQFSRLQLELTRTRTRWTRGILSFWMNNWNPSFDSVEEISPRGARGPAYIALPNERGSSDQYDLNRTVFLDPQRRWSTIRETCPDWSLGQGSRPREEGGHPAPGPAQPPVRSRGFWSLLYDRKLAHTLISLCKPEVWAFPPYFLITPCRNRQHQNSWNSVR